MVPPSTSRITPASGNAAGSRVGPPFQRLTPSDHIVRAILAVAKAETARRDDRYVDPGRIAKAIWPGDGITPEIITRTRPPVGPDVVTRAVSVPADTTTSGGWAQDLVMTAWPDMLASIAAPFAFGGLVQRAHQFQFDGTGNVAIPGVVAAATDTPWVAQGAPIPVRQLSFAPLILQPHKIGVIFVLTREMVENVNGEQAVHMALSSSLGAKLDTALLGNAPTPPAGLLAGLSTLGASSGTTVDAMRLDIGKLADATAAVGSDLVFVGAPGMAAKMRVGVGAQFPYPILSSGVVPAQTLLCVAADCLVVCIDPQPQISASRAAVVHMEGDIPLPIVDASGTVASSVRSTWQTDSIAIRIIAQLSFALRHASGCAFISSVTW